MTAVQVSNGQTPLPGLLPTFPELHVVRAADHQVAAVQGELGVGHVREPEQESWSILTSMKIGCQNWRALLIYMLLWDALYSPVLVGDLV